MIRSLPDSVSLYLCPAPKSLAWLTIFAMALTSALAACGQERPIGEPVEEKIQVRAIPKAPPGEASDGTSSRAEKHSLDGTRLRWLAGFALEADHERFGGFSGLLVDGHHLLAISDRGWWWRGGLVTDSAGMLTGVEGVSMQPIADLDGGVVFGRDRFDAEELTRWRGGLVVSFEGQHRLHFYRSHGASGAPDGGLWPASALPQLIPSPPFQDLPENGGMEAVTTLADGRLLVFTEDGRNDDDHLQAFVSVAGGRSEDRAFDPEEEVEWAALTLEPTEDFKPTSAATLPGGDVLLVERSFHPLRGVRIRLSRLDVAAIHPGRAKPLVPEELGRLLPPLPVDNVEAVDIATAADGRTLIYLLADDNFRSFQETLLIQLELLAAESSATTPGAGAE